MKKQILFLLLPMFVTNISFSQFGSVTNLTPVSTTTNTGEKPQSKTWMYAGKHWCVLANSTGTHVWRLDGTTWTKTLTLAPNTYAKPDCKVVGSVTHVLVYNKNKSYLYSLEYDPASNAYVPWSPRKTKVDLALDAGVQTATIDIDGTGRMWLASDGTTNLNVRYSDPPYSNWSAPMALATGVIDDDICTVVSFAGKIGFFWSNETTKRFGFKTHTDGADPATWSADEQPGSLTAENVGGGFADNHLNVKATSDGKIYCAIKTNYNTTNYTQIGLLIRQPGGTWDPTLYPIAIKSGTRPIVIVDESTGKLKVVYTATDGGGNIVYKETSTSSISFGPENMLISGVYDNSTSTKGSYSNEVVILASNSTQAVGVLAKDAASPPADITPPTVTGITRQNPLTQNTNLTSVTYRAVFSESVTGVNAADFSLTAVTGTVTGTVGTVTAVSGSTYDVQVTGISGNGDLRLDLKASATGIADAAGNAIMAGFTSGEVYSINQTAPTLTSVTIASNNATPSLAKTGDVVTLSFTASQTINTPSVTIATHTVTATAGSGNSYTASYTMAATDAAGIVPFTINFSNTAGTAGTPVTATTNGSSVTFDKTPPTVTGITRQNPSTQNTNLTSVTYRAVFSESVTGVNAADFSLTAVTGTVTGTVGTVTAVTTATPGSTYDVQVTGISGNGDLRLDLKASATGIVDAAGNAIVAGFTSGEVYSINQTTPPVTLNGFAQVTYLTPLDISSHTGQKPQAKTWKYDNKWWAALSTTGGTYILKLDNNTNSWIQSLKLSSASNAKCDVRVVGDIVHILLFRGTSSVSNFASVQYDPAAQTYKFWSQRPSLVNITFEAGTETATLDMDSRGILWIASDGDTDVRVRWSASPYSSWSAPIILETGITTDDICSVTALKDGKIGVFWGNQNTQRFGFKTHTDGADPATWSADENPASQSALSVGHGFSDDHLQLMLASNGTLYVAMKTSYDLDGYPKVGLLVRRPAGTWDNLYPVTTNMVGTRPMVILNETIGKVKVLYTSLEGGGDIRYKEALISDLTTFSQEFTLFTGNYNYLTSTHQTYSPDIAVIVTDQSSTQLRAAGFLGSDVASSSSTSITSAPLTNNAVVNLDLLKSSSKTLLEVYPNPVPRLATINFTAPETGNYTLSVHDLKGAQASIIKQGWAEAGKTQTVLFDGSQLASGTYLLRLQNNRSAKTIKLMLMK